MTRGEIWLVDQPSYQSGLSGELTRDGDETYTTELWNGRTPSTLSPNKGILAETCEAEQPQSCIDNCLHLGQRGEEYPLGCVNDSYKVEHHLRWDEG